jgi:hypothetical protein
MKRLNVIEEGIHNTVELSSICRGEWCRLLESNMDELVDELHDYLKSGEANDRFCLASMNQEVRKGYRNTVHDLYL